MARLIALVYAASLPFVLSCAGEPGLPPDSTPTPAEAGGVVGASTPTPDGKATLPPAALNRVEMTFSTTSDRAAVDISTPGNVLTVRLVSTSDGLDEVAVSTSGMVLGQARSGAEGGRLVSMTVEYTVDEAALRGPMELRLEKGPLGSSELRVVRLTPGGVQVLRHVSHRDTPNLPPGEPMTVVIPWVGE